jgi:hypothetical protein
MAAAPPPPAVNGDSPGPRRQAPLARTGLGGGESGPGAGAPRNRWEDLLGRYSVATRSLSRRCSVGA